MEMLWMCLKCKINGTHKGHKMTQEEQDLIELEQYVASLDDGDIENEYKKAKDNE